MKNYAEQFGYDRRTGKQWAQTGRMLHAPDGRCRTYMQILAVCLMLLFPAKTVYAEETARLQETAEETNTGGESGQTGATGLWQYLQEFGEKTTQSGWSSGEDLWQYLTALGETVRSGEGQGGDFWQHLTGLGEVICSDWMQEEELRQYLTAIGETAHGAWVQSGDFWQYVWKPGTFVRDGWIRDNGVWYYFDSEGNMAAGTTMEIHGHSYSFDESGAWTEAPGAVQPFASLACGRFENSVYEHPWAGVRLTLPENTLVWSEDMLSGLSAFDYIPSYYDFLAVIPGKMAIGMVVQYNNDPLERILEDDRAVFSDFWGTFDFEPSEPEEVTVAGYPCKRISCQPFGTMHLDAYLHQKDNKVWYLLVLAPEEQGKAVREMMASVVPAG